ncbi:DUF4124 domain-containing protein [Pseudoduganella namucuonensis]|uniref:Uncharacterized protein n=1 Tax=Pseudoduganella namucuonensis TaxID=1035707 RepID=A0A1I7LME6_9BURK|nr:DUF4124 domain-containing protein [Pseudoduganella namucuonensis]SFV10770.1 protein of unknown function [Pseudoduganella namucuonensis]
MATAQAQQIYLCVDAGGHKELTDTRKHAGCKPLDIPGAIPAPAPRRVEGAQRPRAPAPAPAATPGDFPRVDSGEQKARDNDRRQILQDELSGEQARLTELKREFNGGEPERRGDERNYAKYQERVANLKDSISRSEKNVEALKREIANIR